MIAIIVRALGWLGSLCGLQFGWQKALFTTLMTVTLGLVLYNLGVAFVREGLEWGITELGTVQGTGAPVGTVGGFTGLMGYLGLHLRLPECLSVIVTCATMRLTIKLIAGLVPGLSGLK